MKPSHQSVNLLPQLVRRALAPINAKDRQRAAGHLLDWFACAAAGASLPQAAMFRSTLSSTPPAGLLWTLAEQSDPLKAVLADGALGSLLEMDDVHRTAVLHPGPVVIPAALAAAAASGAQVSTLLDGIVRGYEVMIRLGRALGLEHYRHWHPSSTCGAFGAAMAAATIQGLDAEHSSWALGNAGTRTGGLWQMRHEAVPSKMLHTALAAQTGFLAAGLAGQGFAGPLSLLEGNQGLFAAMAPTADADVLLASGSGWLIHEVSFKPWPACRHAHPAIDALLAIKPCPAADEIERITVETYPAALDFCDCLHPTTPGEARFSLQHALASVLARGRPRLDHYEVDALDKPPIRALRERIELRASESFGRRFPAHFGAAVRVLTRNGDSCEARVDDAWGDPERPLADRDLAAKAAELFRYAGLEATLAERLTARVLRLAESANQTALPTLREAWS